MLAERRVSGTVSVRDPRMKANLMPWETAVSQFIVPWNCDTSMPVSRAIKRRFSRHSRKSARAGRWRVRGFRKSLSPQGRRTTPGSGMSPRTRGRGAQIGQRGYYITAIRARRAEFPLFEWPVAQQRTAGRRVSRPTVRCKLSDSQQLQLEELQPQRRVGEERVGARLRRAARADLDRLVRAGDPRDVVGLHQVAGRVVV